MIARRVQTLAFLHLAFILCKVLLDRLLSDVTLLNKKHAILSYVQCKAQAFIKDVPHKCLLKESITASN